MGVPQAIPVEPEEARLAALQSYAILGSAPEQGYQDITELASFICGASMSLISFVDADRQWFKATHGITIDQTPLSHSFCAHATATSGARPATLVIEDALADPRFANNPLVTGEPNIRFYAGAPIVEKDGHILGAVCVLDREPRTLTARQVSALEALARQVVSLLEQRTAIRALHQAALDARTADTLVQASEFRLQSFVDALPALAWIANRDGYITWFNARWYEYTGTTPQQMEGWGWQSVHDPAVLPDVIRQWTGSIASGNEFNMIFPLRGADGIFRSFLTRILPFRDAEGEILHWFGTNTEIDELQRTRLALEQSEAGLAQVLNATSDAVLSIRRDWTISYLNPIAEQIYGLSADMVNRNLWDAMPTTLYEGSPFTEHYQRAMNERLTGRFEAEQIGAVSTTLGVEVYPTPDGIVTFSRDITQLKHATAAVMQNEKLAAVGRLASSIAHEINNPLEAVTNLLYLARTSSSLTEAHPYLATADIELRRVAAITNKTLRFHRQATRATNVTFAELLDGILTGQHSRLNNTRVRVLQRDRARLPVCCFEGEIRQVLSNLIGNAIDAMNATGGTLFLRGRDGHDWTTGRPGLVLTVADSGSGITPAVRARIFDAFFTTKGIGGTGLGLWISREIVDRHHGVLSLRTSQRPGRSGTIFTLFLPHDAIEPASFNGPTATA